jgi:triacylglycerol lipase
MPSIQFPKKPLPPPTLERVLKPANDSYDHFEHGAELPFDAGATSFSRLNAWWLADAALLAYWPAAEVERRFQNAGFTKVQPFGRKNTQCFVASNDAVAIVTFRGTEPDALQDLLTDIEIVLDPWKAPGERTHHGFQDALDVVWSDLRDHLTALGPRPLWFTGHSLGAALATLAGDRLLLECGIQPGGIYTFGCPLVGERVFVDGFNLRHRDRSFRFVNDRDGVPTLPPRQIGYRHVNDERLIGFDDANVFDFAETIIDHTPRRYAVLAWNGLVDSEMPA